jgi:energy-coupling factor transport system permease protein
MPVTYSLYVAGSSWLHQRDARAKLLWLFCGFLLTLTFNNPFYILALLCANIIIGATAGLKFSSFQMILGSSLVFAIFGITMWPFYFQQGTTLFYVVGNPITVDGLLFGLASGLRVGVMITIGTIWITTTSPQQITTALIKMGLPSKAATGITLTLRFVPMLKGEITTIMEAQRSRGLDFNRGNPLVRVKKYIPVIIPVMMRAFIIAQQLGLALDAKGFGISKDYTILHNIRMNAKDYVFGGLWLFALVSSLLLRMAGFGVIAKNLL